MIDLSVRIIKELKGPPLSVWMALIFAGDTTVKQAWIVRNTGYTDKSVRQALEYLVEHGFAIRSQKGWKISNEIRRLPSLIKPMDSTDNLKERSSNSAKSDQDCQGRNYSDTPISIINKGLKDSIDSINTNNKSRNYSDLCPHFSAFPEVGQALIDAGIRENSRTRRLLGRITARDVRTMVSKIRDDPMHDLSETGLMVTILEGTALRNERRGGYESWNT